MVVYMNMYVTMRPEQDQDIVVDPSASQRVVLHEDR